MGMEIQIDSLEDMCALMCDNVIPEKGSDKEDEQGVDSDSQNHTRLLDMDIQ